MPHKKHLLSLSMVFLCLPSIRLSVMLSLPKPLDEIQPNLVCEKLKLQWQTFFATPPGACGSGQISFNFNYKVNFKDFFTKLCLRSHKWKIQNISDRIFILLPGSCPRGGGTLGALGVPRGSKKIFKHGHVAFQSDGDDEQNRMLVKFSS